MDANNEQVQKIEGEKKALRNQLIVLTVLSFVVSFAFYGITLMQNPFNKSDWAKVKLTCLEDRKDLQREKGAEFWMCESATYAGLRITQRRWLLKHEALCAKLHEQSQCMLMYISLQAPLQDSIYFDKALQAKYSHSLALPSCKIYSILCSYDIFCFFHCLILLYLPLWLLFIPMPY